MWEQVMFNSDLSEYSQINKPALDDFNGGNHFRYQ